LVGGGRMAQERVSKAEVDRGVGGAGAGNVEEVPKKVGSKPRKSVTSFLAGGGAGMLSTTLLQPLEVVKTHMQAAENAQDRRFKVVVSRILGEDGVKGLWRGTGPACVRVGLGAGLYFAVLGPMVETMRSAFASGEAYTRGDGGSLKEKLPALVTLSAGALTRSIASSVVCPITVIKTRMEVSFLVQICHRPQILANCHGCRDQGSWS
jgi:hypothetical protein